MSSGSEQTRALETQRRRLVVESLLHHLEAAEFRDDFAVRGAWSFAVWHGEPHRETQSLDLIYLGAEQPETALRAACLSIGPLAIRWDKRDVIKTGNEWTERTRLQVRAPHRGRDLGLTVNIAHNVGHLEHVERRRFRGRNSVAPTLVSCLSPEWLAAEKAALLVTYGPDHTRLQDLLDLWVLNRRFEFDRRCLIEAFLTVARGRDAERMVRRQDGYWEAAFDPIGRPRSLFERWDTIAARYPQSLAPGLQKTLVEVSEFLWPILSEIREREPSSRRVRPATKQVTRITRSEATLSRQAMFPFYRVEPGN